MTRRDRLVRDALRSRFVITLSGGQTFEGLLSDVDASTVVLVDAYALDTGTRVSVDGSLYLPRAEVLYMQKPHEARP